MTYRFNGATSLQLGVFVLSLTLVHYNCLTFAMPGEKQLEWFVLQLPAVII